VLLGANFFHFGDGTWVYDSATERKREQMKLKDLLPEFYSEVEQLIAKQGLTVLIEQLPYLEIAARCPCGDDFCSSFNVKPWRELNVVEQNIVLGKLEKTIELGAESGYVIVDIDNCGRIIGFEVLYRDDVDAALEKAGFKKIISE